MTNTQKIPTTNNWRRELILRESIVGVDSLGNWIVSIDRFKQSLEDHSQFGRNISPHLVEDICRELGVDLPLKWQSIIAIYDKKIKDAQDKDWIKRRQLILNLSRREAVELINFFDDLKTMLSVLNFSGSTETLDRVFIKPLKDKFGRYRDEQTNIHQSSTGSTSGNGDSDQ